MTFTVNDRRGDYTDALTGPVAPLAPMFDFVDSDAHGVGEHIHSHPRGGIADIAKHVGEEAAIRWDIDVVGTMPIVPDNLRFVKKRGYWRAFGGETNSIDGLRVVSGLVVFLAQWEPDVAADATGIPGAWLRRNSLTTAVDCELIDRDGIVRGHRLMTDKIRDWYDPRGRVQWHRIGITRRFKRGTQHTGLNELY